MAHLYCHVCSVYTADVVAGSDRSTVQARIYRSHRPALDEFKRRATANLGHDFTQADVLGAALDLLDQDTLDSYLKHKRRIQHAS